MTMDHAGKTYDITNLICTTSWSGDKSAISRQLAVELACAEGLPRPELGDRLWLEDGDVLFEGTVLRRDLTSDALKMNCTAFDRGYYLQRNSCTYKFTGASPEAITRRVCEDLGIPVAQVPSTGLSLRRKFAGVAGSQVIFTAWSLAREQTGKEYAIHYSPAGLVVRERTISTSSPVLAAGANLMDAKTVEDASKVVNSVAIYDAQGNFLRRSANADSQQLVGVMESHVTQSEGKSAQANNKARDLLDGGKISRTVTVNVLGDTAQITGATVVAREATTGLTGVFWIDGDVHTWKNGAHYARLTLNCRNVMTTTSAGSEIK